MNEKTYIGNIGRDEPVLTFSKRTGEAVLRFSMAEDDAYFDRTTSRWVDNKPVWTDVVVFGEMAQDAADCLHAGSAVIVVGKLADNSFTPEGADRPVRRTQLKALHIGPDLRRGPTPLARRPRHERTGSTTAPEPSS
ncbi:single-stranded DNA-binding protein [Pseudonocardia sp. NPDC049635]|uniref:single-stranded DNA-binding protein n=1 Tax=Pseudonocardia sp. NPDC049635 TaxID=3155506 RepID=UPI0033F0E05D